MQKLGDSIQLSATDLVGHLNCRHLTSLDIAVANGTLKKPKVWDPLLEILWERGARHEQGFVEHLKSQGLSITVIDGVGIDDESVARTRSAMAAGEAVIVQGAFRTNGWTGRTDVLRRVETPSDLGPWSYEVTDTKLARETKGGTVLQLCLYAELVANVQGARPKFGYVVAPWSNYEPQRYRMDDYAAYYRRVRSALQAAVGEHAPAEIYPEPKEHCDVCRWQDRCDKRRRADDHLSLVAGITRAQRDELKRQGVETTADLATMPLPLAWKPSRGAAHSYERVREQARIQVDGRKSGEMKYELLPVVSGFGLSILPEPSHGDIFFDLESDPFAGEGGLEYLFGYTFADSKGHAAHISDWAFSREEEKRVFERFVDFVMHRLEQHPDLHIYHFAPYEPAALKRLMGRYACREEEIDFLLRSHRFVDLHSAVRNGLRASVESYSIKKLEPLYGFMRSVELPDANAALTKVQTGLELGDLGLIDEHDRTVVAGYNRDDCVSTWRLRDWLETRRTDLTESGAEMARPEVSDGAPPSVLSKRQERVNALIARLTADVPLTDRSREQHARWLLAYMLDWHWREMKVVYWEKYRLANLPADDLLDERAGLSGLTFMAANGGTARCPIHRYRFPPQETEVRAGADLYNVGGAKFGSVEAISLEERWVEIKKRTDTATNHPEAVFSHKLIGTDEIADSLFRIGEYVADHGIEGDGPYQPARDLLMRLPPRLGGQEITQPGESTLDSALRIATAIEGGVLPIQGPPGSGKTYTGARMICALVQSRKTVGVTAVSHKVIRKLLDEVIEAAGEMKLAVNCIEKAAVAEPDQPQLRFAKSNADLLKAIGNGSQVAGGTAWLWSTPEAAGAVDVLFVDEAAQMSLANVIAVSQAAKTVILLGDPQQLEQVMRGSHPDGTDVSALHHILDGKQTIASDRGLFLEQTWRLHPSICAFTTELFYDGRLHPCKGMEVQQIRSLGRINGAGLRFVAVPTEGNQSSSPQEADCVKGIVDEILASKATWVDKDGLEQPVELRDILVIAPYNAQVFELQDRIPGGNIGTVDKFQGQEAPIVIYSMTTSSYADAPRGMEFLYSLNRLNVATSRAKCLCILVASPSVFEAQCRTPHQMQLANASCRYLELATAIDRPH